MIKKLHLKTLLLLCALIVGSANVLAVDKVTAVSGIVSGGTYYIGASISNTDYYLKIDGSSTGTAISGTATSGTSDAARFVITKDGDSYTLNFVGTSNYLSMGSSNGKMGVTTTATKLTFSNQTGAIRITNGTRSLQLNKSTKTQFGSYANTQQDVWLLPAIADNDFTITSETTVNLTITADNPNPTSTVTWTTSSDGALTWESSDQSVVTVSNGIITAVGAGNATVTVSQAATNGYTASETKTFTVNVTDARKLASDFALTDAPIALSFDIYNNATSQVIRYTTSSTGAVTVEESEYIDVVVDTEAKTITVFPKKETLSVQTIIVSQISDATYNAGTANFTVSIDDSTPIMDETITISELGGSNGVEMSQIEGENVTISWDKGTNTNAPKFYEGGSETRLYKGNTMTFKSSDKTIGKIEFTYSSGYNGNNFTASVGTVTEGVWTGATKEVTLTNSASSNTQIRFIAIKITYIEVATFAINAACTDGEGYYYGTFYTDKNYVMPEGVEGAPVTVSDGKLSVTYIYEAGDVVEAKTALLLRTQTAKEYTYTITTEEGVTLDESENMLKDTLTADEETEGENSLFYRLTMHNGETIGFWWGAENGGTFKPGTNKAYLAVPQTEGARKSGFTFGGGNATGIAEVEGVRQNTVNGAYNLQGQRVVRGMKGLVVVNGKKMLNK